MQGTISTQSPHTARIAALNAQISANQNEIRRLDTSLDKAKDHLKELDTLWSDDVVCVRGKLAKNGDRCGPGSTSRVLKANADAYRNTTLPGLILQHDERVKKLNDGAATAQEQINGESTQLKEQVDAAVQPVRDNTGLTAQSQALFELLREDLSIWIWPVFFVVIDLAVALMKGILPESAFDRSRRLKAPLDEKVALALQHSDQLTDLIAYAADKQLEVEKTRIDRRAEMQMRSPVAALDRRTNLFRRRAIAATVAVLLVVVGIFAWARTEVPALGSAPSLRPSGSAVGATSMNLRGGLALEVPPNAISGNKPVLANYPHQESWQGHTPVSPSVELTTDGSITGSPSLSFKVPEEYQEAAKSGAVELAFLDPSGHWVTHPTTYDPTSGRLSAALKHFSTWQFWTWDWISVGASISQTLGEWGGRRATARPTCSNVTPPSWYSMSAGITDEAAMVVRSCVQGQRGSDVLDVQLVNNRPYGLWLDYGGAAVQWGWHDDPSSLPEAIRNVIGDLSSSKGMYLPPLSRASVGIKNIGNGNRRVFSIAPTAFTIAADLAAVVAEKTIEPVARGQAFKKLGDVFAAHTVGSCTAMIVNTGVTIPDRSTVMKVLTGQAPTCIKDLLVLAGRQEVRQGPDMDLNTLTSLSQGIKKMKGFMSVGTVVDVENQLGNVLDFVADAANAKVRELNFGFSLLAHYTYVGPSPTQAQSQMTPSQTSQQTPSPSTSRQQSPTASPTQAITPSPTTTTTPAPSPSSSPFSLLVPTPSTSSATRIEAYSNYGNVTSPGTPMCVGNPQRPESMPGGELQQEFRVGQGVATLDSATVQIDDNPNVTVSMRVFVNGSERASARAVASNDTDFKFAPIPVTAGDSVRLTFVWSGTSGKLDTIYTVGSPTDTRLTVTNRCSDGAPSFATSGTGLRAIIRGWTS